jgi:hypothetical protein
MKKYFVIFSLLFLALGCDNEQTREMAPEVLATAADSIKLYKGDFIYVGKSAVLKGDQFIYEVKVDSMSNSLKESLKEYKLENTNIIPVEVKGKVEENVWSGTFSERIEIKEIVEIFAEKNRNKN